MVDATSLDTKHRERDERLRSADFFNVAAHPDVTYVVHGGEIDADSRPSVAGDLEVAGTTRPLVLTAHIEELSGSSAVLSAEVTIDRSTFGLSWNRLGMIRGPATVTVTASFVREGGE